MPNTNQKVTVAVGVTAAVLTAAICYYNHMKDKNTKEGESGKNIDNIKPDNSTAEKQVTKPLETKKEVTLPESSESSTPSIPSETLNEDDSTEVVRTVSEVPVPEVKTKGPDYFVAYNKGKALFSDKKYDEAVCEFTKSIDSCPASNTQLKMLVYSRASCFKKLNNLDDAIKDWSRCIELDCKYGRAYKARGMAYQSQGRTEEALADYSFCYLMDIVSQGEMQPTPDGMDVAIQTVAKKQTMEELSRRRADSKYETKLPSTQFIAFYFSTITSEVSIEYNRLGLKEDQLTAIIEQYPADSQGVSLGDYFLMRGGLRKSLNRFDEAFSDFRCACEEINGCTNQFAALLEKATFLSLSGDVVGANAIYADLHSRPCNEAKSINLYVKYASCLLELDDDSYHTMFDEAVKENPSSCDGYFHRGQMLFLENEMDRAISDLVTATKLKSSFAMAYVQVAFCYGSKGEFDRAQEYMKKALDCNKQKAQVLNHYGEFLMMCGNVAEAMQTFQKAVAADPTWPYSYVNQSIVAMQTSQDYITAQTLLKKAISIDSDCINAYLQLAQVHMMLQEWEKTDELLQIAFEKSRIENDLQQVCSLMQSVKYQRAAMTRYQQMLKAEA